MHGGQGLEFPLELESEAVVSLLPSAGTTYAHS